MNEFSYILIKNFEAKKLDSNTVIHGFFDNIYERKDNITINEVVEIIFSKFIGYLSIKNENDALKLEGYIKNILASVNNDWLLMVEKFIEMFSSIKIYSEKEEKKFSKKIKKVKFYFYKILVFNKK